MPSIVKEMGCKIHIGAFFLSRVNLYEYCIRYRGDLLRPTPPKVSFFVGAHRYHKPSVPRYPVVSFRQRHWRLGASRFLGLGDGGMTKNMGCANPVQPIACSWIPSLCRKDGIATMPEFVRRQREVKSVFSRTEDRAC